VGQQKSPSFQDQAAQRIQQEALGIAKATQTPGQTKEQTRLIAKGVEKGIAFYKEQQKQKAREQDKARKRMLRQKGDTAVAASEADAHEAGAGDHSVFEPASFIAACVFSIGALVHTLRYFLGVEVIIGSFHLPLAWSLPVAVIAAVLAAWLFKASRRSVF
jgi:hypothetical protein